MTRRLVSLALLMLLAAGGLAGASRAQTGDLAAGALTIDAPAESAAGAPLTIRATSPVADNTTVTLGLSGSFGMLVRQAPIRSGVATFDLTGAETAKSGFVTITAVMSGLRATAAMTIRPAVPVEPVIPLIGARRIVADGSEWSMTVVAPVDAFGNPVAEGTAVDLALVRPNGSQEHHQVATQHLLAWERIVSGTIAGRTTVAASAGGVPGPQGVFDEVPGWPAAIAVTVSPAELTADGRSLVSLATGEIRDANGNLVSDGTAVLFVAANGNGREYRLPAETIAGIARAKLLAPQLSATLSVRAIAGDVVSEPVPLVFADGPAVGTIPVMATAGEEIIVTAGPILSPQGGYVANGVDATFTVTGMGISEALKVPVVDGTAVLKVLASYPTGDYEIRVTVGSATGATRISIN
jgi:hypothetical protein